MVDAVEAGPHEAEGAVSTPVKIPPTQPLATARGEGDGRLQAIVRAALGRLDMTIEAPAPGDYVLLLRGVPVAPWIPARPGIEVWGTWLRWLERRWAKWNGGVRAQDTQNVRDVQDGADLDETWEAWRAQHVLTVQVRHAGGGLARVVALLGERRFAGRDVHLIGHSVGGAAALAYLARSRMGLLPAPLARIRTVVTLDAAVTGLAGVWSDARRGLGTRTEAALHGLGEWAAERGIAVLTACNERDVWSHRALADLPYVGLPLGPAFALRAQLDGTVHGWLRRTPLLVEALWGAASGADGELSRAHPADDRPARAPLAATPA